MFIIYLVIDHPGYHHKRINPTTTIIHVRQSRLIEEEGKNAIDSI